MLNYSQEYLDSLPVFSKSHNTVSSDGDIFYKKAYSEEGNSAIVLEYNVNKMLGREVELYSGPPVSILMPRYGYPINNDIDESFIHQAMRTMFDVGSTLSENDHIYRSAPKIVDYTTIYERRIAQRIADGKNPLKVLKDFPDSVMVGNFRGDGFLCHRDPRLDNWLYDFDGRLMMIDWESAVTGDWEFAVTCFASYIFEAGFSHLVEEVFNVADSFSPLKMNRVQCYSKIRRSAMCSWYYEDEGYSSGDKWWNDFTKLWNDLNIAI